MYVNASSSHAMIMKAKLRYVGIRVKELQKSIDFYTELLDMKIKSRTRVEQSKGETVNLATEDGGFILELNYYEKDSPYYAEYSVGEGLDHLAFKADNLDKALEEAKSSGYQMILEMNVKEGRWAYIQDPNGIWIELF